MLIAHVTRNGRTRRDAKPIRYSQLRHDETAVRKFWRGDRWMSRRSGLQQIMTMMGFDARPIEEYST